MPSSLVGYFALVWALAIGIGAAAADDLLVIKPVTNEVLGHLRAGSDGKAVFFDCAKNEYDPKLGTVKPTQDTCDGPGGIMADFKPIGDYLQGPVYASDGTELGTIDSLTVTPDRTKLDVLLTNGTSIPFTVKDAANWSALGDDKSRLVLGPEGLDWTAAKFN